MNLLAVDVERSSEKPLMSGFHALFSIGGFLGSGIVTALLSRGVAPSSSTILSSAILVSLILVALPRMLSNRERTKQPLFAIPRGIVLVIAIFAAISFLVEGALLDWSALLLVGEHLVSAAHGGWDTCFLHRDDVQPLRRRWHRGAIREPNCADTWWGDSASRIVRIAPRTRRMDRACQFRLCGPWSRKHRAYLVQTRGYATHNA